MLSEVPHVSYDHHDHPHQRGAQRVRRCEFRESGAYENVSEYICDLIRRDKERAERETFGRLKAELACAFAAPEVSYLPLTAAEVIVRNRRT